MMVEIFLGRKWIEVAFGPDRRGRDEGVVGMPFRTAPRFGAGMETAGL